MAGALSRWWFEPVPPRRIDVLRVIVYAFLPLDMVLFTGGVWGHAEAATSVYRPVLLARLLHLPAADPALVRTLFAVVVAAGLVAATGRLPRAAGYVAALGYAQWVLLAMSYGKVDHDHLALVVALFVLPGAGRASAEAAGWATRCVQVAVVATYFLSAYAKIRHGGWEWPNGATFQWAVTRRGTFLGHFLAGVPGVLLVGQWFVLLAEAASPVLLFLRGRPLRAGVTFFLLFHLTTWAAITIHFLPHVICLAAFLPLERARLRRGTGPAAAGPAAAAAGVSRDRRAVPR
ncbi:hypothetical protein [Streptosporangium sp. NPDC023615]|uniref:hypothetical protein n=1 Tax=Streptosporangium sp. NPDC023615 TaxID=3154794 RepID=UPI003448D8A8